ncbi:hypothetical protein [Kitasatospora sp. NPDC056531]|uniref:hypothetical protein n=1 Tax=Kitasatospora sp. NPDC056531 TaxID=3345856 RepID=UPI00369B422F
MDLEALRAELHRAVDAIIDRHLNGESGGDGPQESVSAVGQPYPNGWEYQWPGGKTEDFHQAQDYDVDGDSGRHRVVVAWASRQAWGRKRLRAIVFLALKKEGRYYPLTEFVETDDERFAATIPRPGNARAQLRIDDPMPERLRGHVVERADVLFTTIANSSAVRLVLEKDDEEEMVRHAYWVASERNRF